MHTAYIIVTLVAAAANIYAATNDFMRVDMVVDNMSRLGIPQTQMLPLGVLKAAGAAGLLVGIGVPPIGIAAAVGLVLFFVGAVATAMRAHWYAHVPYPATFLLLAVASLALRLAA
jgi:DoxX-like family